MTNTPKGNRELAPGMDPDPEPGRIMRAATKLPKPIRQGIAKGAVSVELARGLDSADFSGLSEEKPIKSVSLAPGESLLSPDDQREIARVQQELAEGGQNPLVPSGLNFDAIPPFDSSKVQEQIIPKPKPGIDIHRP
jgi:hypothetical protein